MTDHRLLFMRITFFCAYIFRYLFAFRGARSGQMLDVGAGFGHFCAVAKFFGHDCYAIEPRKECESYLAARKVDNVYIGAVESFQRGRYFDLASVITVLDECVNKEQFLRSLGGLLNDKAVVYVEVRNLDFLLKINNGLATDISYVGYLGLFEKTGFKVLKVTGWARPLTFGSCTVFLKTAISNLFFFIPWQRKQMLGFKLEFSSATISDNI